MVAITKTVEVDIDVELDDFDDDDIEEEYKSRFNQGGDILDELRILFQSGRTDQIADVCRAAVNDKYGTCY